MIDENFTTFSVKHFAKFYPMDSKKEEKMALFQKKKQQQKNEITVLLSRTDLNDDEKTEQLFGQPKYVNLLQLSLRSEIEILLKFIIDNVEKLLVYVLEDPKDPEEAKLEVGKYAMISRNIALSLSSSSNKLRTKLSRKNPEGTTEDELKEFENAQKFQNKMIDFIDSDNANINTSNHWGRIMASFVANPKYMFFKDKVDEILPKLILNTEYPGYRDLIQSIASQNTNDKIFRLISEGIADNMREYKIYSNDSASNKEIVDLLYLRSFYLLKIINQCYAETIELNLGTWEDKYEIVRNLLEATISETDKKLVLDAGVNILCIVLDIINKSHDDDDDDDEKDEKDGDDDDDDADKGFDKTVSKEIPNKLSHAEIIRKLVKAKGKSFYQKQGLYDIEFTPETPYSDEKFDLIFRTFPIFWEAGINKLSPLLFHGCKTVDECPKECKDSMTPTKVTKTIIDKIIMWASIANKDDHDYEPTDEEVKRANRKLNKFIEENKVVEYMQKYFPKNLANADCPFLNPFIIILAQVLIVGHFKAKVEYNGNVGESTIIRSEKRLNFPPNCFPETMNNDEFTRFYFENIIPISNEFNKTET